LTVKSTEFTAVTPPKRMVIPCASTIGVAIICALAWFVDFGYNPTLVFLFLEKPRKRLRIANNYEYLFIILWMLII